MGDPRTQLLADGYDAIGESFSERRERIVADPRREWENGLLLELGCRAGPAELQWVLAHRR